MPTGWLDEKPGRSPANRSLERGIEVLRAFRPGSALLANSELAERTGIAKATLSRLTQTLVGAGMLQLDPRARAYRLAPGVLSLAHAMRSGSRILATAAPLMRTLAERERLNVGLAAADRDEMVYLESIRYNRRVSLRNVVSGQRVPMELTSLGRAYLATVDDNRRRRLHAVFRSRRGGRWPELAEELRLATRSVREQGWCAAAWQPQVVAVAAPLPTPEATYVLNVSVLTEDPPEEVASALAPHLLGLLARVQEALARENPDAGPKAGAGGTPARPTRPAGPRPAPPA